jgi:metallophosphoesterase (TIGR00282 family)
MIGDVVGEPGLKALERRLPALIEENGITLTVVNGENAAAGFGLDEAGLGRILAAGADAVTNGNHVWEKREFWPVLEAAAAVGKPPVLRPANYAGAPGTGVLRVTKKGPDGPPLEFLVVNLQGREYMTAIDCPFRCFDKTLEDNSSFLIPHSSFVLVDFHAESAPEKEALAYYCDGRASVVAGTHTHVQTADERVLPKGTAYITDLGMTGASNGVIGMDASICLKRAKNQISYRMECAEPASESDLVIQGIIAELDTETGKALSVRRI